MAADKIICDLDVDAPDLHLLLKPTTERQEEFYSGHEAEIDREKCDGCGLCATMCQFGAIRENGAGFVVNPVRCEGCKVCVAFCPGHRFPEALWPMVRLIHPLRPPGPCATLSGTENSNWLVMAKQRRELAKARKRPTVLCGGAPGIIR
jgi:ferredoxin